jgi:multidrug efflux pump
MSLPSLCIRRPVFTVVLNLLVILAGLAGLQTLPIRELPAVSTPVISVTTDYAGAEASLVETQVTTPLEEQLGGIEGLRFMTSTSSAGRSQISLTFTLDTDQEAAANEVRSRVDKAVGALPDDAERPTIAKTDPDATPILYITFDSDLMVQTAITEYLNRFLVNSFRAIDGVGQVMLFGGRDYQMSVRLRPEDLAAHGLTVTDVATALESRNVDIPAGSITVGPNRYALRTATTLDNAEAFKALVVAGSGANLVRLGDLGEVTLGGTDESNAISVMGQPSVGLGIVRTATANPLDVAKDTRALLAALQPTLPQGLNAQVVFDSTVFIERSIDEVKSTIVEAFVLVLAIIVVFLASLRTSLIPLVTIPVSIIGVLALMAVLGYSINTLTLLAIVMAIGLVVDDAIVVVENIHRHVERGLPPMEAAHRGMKEVTFAVVAMTLTLAAVFAPLGLMSGTVGQFFREFAFTLAGAVLVSGFVALTLSPMMCARLLKGGPPNAFARRVDRVLGRLSDGYAALLRRTLTVRPLVVVLALAVGGLGAWLYVNLKSEMVPTEDQGYLLVIQLTPTNSSLDTTKALAERVAAATRQATPGLDREITIAGMPQTNRAMMLLTLKPWEDRPDLPVQAVQGAVHAAISRIPGVIAIPILPVSFGSDGGGQPVSLAIRTLADYDSLNELMGRLVTKANALPQLTAARSDLKLDSLRFSIAVDRDRAAALGITEAEMGAALSALFGGQKAGTFQKGGREYDVQVRLTDDHRSGPKDVDQVHLRAASGAMVPLDAVVTLSEDVAPASLAHYDQSRSATLSASLAPGVALGDALKALTAAIEDDLPAGTTFAYSGQSLDYVESQGGTTQVFALAVLVIFLVLAAQFESFRSPLAIMLTVPLAIAGALLALTLTGHTSNVYSMIGMITLVGLITKHGILICEFANQLRDEGKDKKDAVVAAARERLRPILMTTGAMVLGLLPLAFASGPGAVGRQAIGWSVIGGLLVGTALTLFVVPTMYSYLAGRRAPAE